MQGTIIAVSLSGGAGAPPWELENSLQNISLNGLPDRLDRHGVGGLPCATGSADMQIQPAFGMYPMMLQPPFGSDASYMTENYSNVGQTTPSTPMSLAYSALGAPYQAPPSPALTLQNHQSPSRSTGGFGQVDVRRYGGSRPARSSHLHHAASHHNHVDIHRIRGGIDVRTTVCIPRSMR